ncbi:MAG: hypothetical protein CVU71_01625 [Deltaproteobacteria bacterium HGW-Deltaproteobacteria-6]|jgi:serine kinase of HPr protein (carbohydrate metabolism regulator)|nr:MAG: hypothetical protein CVU71_01625 [Deltaproteobacteria bacterium HGW-Deltaproteobacteria-6]
MSPVLHKKSLSHKTATLENIFQDRLPLLGIREIFAAQNWKKSSARPHIRLCRSIGKARYRENEIIILTPGALEKLIALADPLREEYFAGLAFCKAALLIFSQCMILPVHLKKRLKRHRLPAAASALHECLLESRIKAILQEKINKCVAVHGIALEIQGRGILITGQSGIGKTTTAIRAAQEGCVWIADDIAVIKKQNDKLLISGHRKIKDYLYTGQTGIVPVDEILRPSDIKSKAVLTAIIDVIRTDTDDACFELVDKDVLKTRLPCLRIEIPRTGYLNKNLLKKAARKLRGVA